MTNKYIEVHKSGTITGHKSAVYNLVSGKENPEFYSFGGDGYVIKWNLENLTKGTLICQLDAPSYCGLYLEEKNSLIVAENGFGIRVIDLKSKKMSHSFAICSSSIFAIQKNGSHILIANESGELIILNQEDFSVSSKIKLSNKSIRDVLIFENKIYLSCSDSTIKILDQKTYILQKSFIAHNTSVFGCIATENEIISIGRDSKLKIWNNNDNFELKKDISAHIYAINNISFSPDKKHFATCSMDKTIKVWRTYDKKLLKVIDHARHEGHSSSVNRLLWSTYNDWLISCSDDKSISVWKLNILEE